MKAHLVPLVLGLLAGLGSTAQAHDTWFHRLPADDAGVSLALGTGDRFPRLEFAVGFEHLAHAGCAGADGMRVPLRHDTDQASALHLRAPLRLPAAPATCWAQLQPHRLEGLEPAKVEQYFREIQAGPAVREAWRAMQARGLPWKESYTKHARIELGEGAHAARPSGMAMDVLLETPALPAQPRQMLGFLLLRDGQPLADFPVEFRSDLSPIGLWRRTDAQGRVHFAPPLAARWVLRGTDLRVAEGRPDEWESRFVTLAFDVEASLPGAAASEGPLAALPAAPAGPQNGSSSSPNSRSTSHTAASAAISSEPPTSTPRR